MATAQWQLELKKRGYTVHHCGEKASARQMGEACANIMRAAGSSSVGSYNGRGGVERQRIEGSDLLDAREGAPREVTVQFHNEMAYSDRFPEYVAFAMTRREPRGLGGHTMVCDNTQVVRHLTAGTLAKMRELGVLYVRQLQDVKHRGKPTYYNSWQGAFGTDSLAEALQRGNAPDNAMLVIHPDGETLTHTVWCPLFHEETLFGAILSRHGSWLDGHAVFGLMPLQQRPYHCLWGDGTEISPDELTEFRHAHDMCTHTLHLKQGDVIVIDNLRCQHGRTPYTGDRALGLMLSGLIQRHPEAPHPAFRAAKRSGEAAPHAALPAKL